MTTTRSNYSYPACSVWHLFDLRTRCKFLSILILIMQVSNAVALDGDLKASDHFTKGEQLYNSGKYEEALPELQLAVELSQSNSHYHHMLGKCHGRIAENGSWLTALRNVGKTLTEFKRAIELDANNVQALVDLEEFYLRAPGFLGGSNEKATEIRKRLESLEKRGVPDPTIEKN